jgi:DNA-binding Xre family transcriptional regulator
VTREAAYRWRLPHLVDERGMRSTVELGPLLAERGVVLSDAQVYRLVHYTPERLSLKTLSALCDIFGCTPNDLIQPYVEGRSGQERVAGGASPGGDRGGAADRNSGLGRLPEGFSPVAAEVLGQTRRRDRS